MNFEIAVFLAALGITVLEMSEASAVAMALSSGFGTSKPYLLAAGGVLVVMIPAAIVGNLVSLFPLFYVRIFSATFLLYFGIRLARSARRSQKFQRIGFPRNHHEEAEKGISFTAFSVGAVEAFEAAIVLVALYPESYSSTLFGLTFGIVIVIAASYILRNQIRRVKQATVKVSVSAILLSFSAFWYIESVKLISDIFLVPIFIAFFIIVYEASVVGLPRRESAAS
ncbi:MAG: hypothetical protein M1431_00120 [Candidatus Thermoplasmatota archaeon]|nr:hypothetical protein [Candidatus Thermoplasmatota archaeon]